MKRETEKLQELIRFCWEQRSPFFRELTSEQANLIVTGLVTGMLAVAKTDDWHISDEEIVCLFAFARKIAQESVNER